MNKNFFCISVLFGAALLGAARAQSMPESQVSSPVEETVQSGRSLDGTKNASWEQKRAERRVAREKTPFQIAGKFAAGKGFYP